MHQLKSFIKNQYQLIAAILIFGSFLLFQYSFSILIILMLEFIIVLEVVKMVDEFIKKGKIRLRHAIDGFIIGHLRKP